MAEAVTPNIVRFYISRVVFPKFFQNLRDSLATLTIIQASLAVIQFDHLRDPDLSGLARIAPKRFHGLASKASHILS